MLWFFLITNNYFVKEESGSDPYKVIEMAFLNTLGYVDDLEKEFDDPISKLLKLQNK